MPQRLPRTDHCLNCDQPATGNFCSNCGQENEDQTVALRPLVADLLADVASFDSRLVQTLKPLFLRPGFLTNEYNAGRRIRYLSPVKLYLVASLLFFLVLSWRNGQTKPIERAAIPNMSRTKSRTAAKNGVQIGRTGIMVQPDELPKTVEEYDAAQQMLPAAQRDSHYRRMFVRQSIKLLNDPAGFLRGLQDNMAKMMFVLLPFFALLLKLLYFRTGRLYVEHLIFALHGHSFVFLAMTAQRLISISVLSFVISVWMLVYLYMALRTVYRQGRAKTFVKYILLGGTYMTAVGVGLAAVALITLLMI